MATSSAVPLCKECGRSLDRPGAVSCDHCTAAVTRKCANCSQNISKEKRVCDICGHAQYKECLLCQSEILSSADQCGLCHAPQQEIMFQYIPLRECLNQHCRTRLIPYLPSCYKCHTSQQLHSDKPHPMTPAASKHDPATEQQRSVIQSLASCATDSSSNKEDTTTLTDKGTSSAVKRGATTDVITSPSKRSKGEDDGSPGPAVVTVPAAACGMDQSTASAGQKRTASPPPATDIASKIMHESTPEMSGDGFLDPDKESGTFRATHNNL